MRSELLQCEQGSEEYHNFKLHPVLPQPFMPPSTRLGYLKPKRVQFIKKRIEPRHFIGIFMMQAINNNQQSNNNRERIIEQTNYGNVVKPYEKQTQFALQFSELRLMGMRLRDVKTKTVVFKSSNTVQLTQIAALCYEPLAHPVLPRYPALS